MGKLSAMKRKNTPLMNVWRKLKKNRWAMVSLVIIIFMVIVAIFAPWLTPYNYAEQNYEEALQPPSWEHPFGTDNFGRDMFSRVIYGSRYTVFMGFGCIIVSAFFGVLLGLVAAYFSKLDNLIMRVMDIIIGMPAMTFLMLLIAVMGISLPSLVIALCIMEIPNFARIVRSQAMIVKSQEFIEGTVAIGASNARILFKHILPNSLAPVIIEFSLGACFIIMTSASLSFIGMGVQAPTPEWGLLINTGRQYLRTNWYLSIIPGLAIILLNFVLNYLGDGLRDAMDPRLNK